MAPVKTWSRALWLLFQLASLPMQGSDLLWVCECMLTHSLVSNSLQPHGLYAAHQVPLSMGFSWQ